MARLLTRLIMTAGVSAALLGTALAADTVAVDYDVSLGGSRIMKASYAANFDGSNYDASFSAKTVGMSKVFSKIKLSLTAKGKMTDGGLQPVSYNYFRKKNDKTKERGLLFDQSGELVTDGAGYDAAVLASLKKSVMDPLSMLLKISRSDKPCSGKHRSFDGRDVFDLSLSTVSSNDGKLVCKLVYTPIAGGDVDDGDTEPQAYEVTLAPTTSAQSFITIRITGRTKGVPFDVSATSAAINGTGLAF